MAQSMMSSSQFSKDGKYFAQITIDGKLKIWETATSTFKQEFTPNLHLTTPCICLHWIDAKSQTPWKKRKRRQSETGDSEETHTLYIAVGTSSGSIFLYSLASAQIESTIDSQTGHAISCLTWEKTQDIYTGAENFVLQFDFKEKKVKSKWKTGNDKVNAIQLIPDKPRLLTASKMIKLWDLETKEVVKNFIGHSYDISVLKYISSTNSDSYFISGSKGDRILSCWSLSEKSKDKNAVASLLMEDIALSVSIVEGSENNTNVVAVTRSGVAHVYQHTLNGKCAKPLKPKVTIQVVSDTGQIKDVVAPIPVIASFYHEDGALLIAHGNSFIITFENVVPSMYEKIQCLIRKDPTKIQTTKEDGISKIKQAVVDDDRVQYLTPHSAPATLKRKATNAKAEVPMEQRLENLTLNKLETGVPKVDNVAQLLVQGLHSKDRTILQNVLSKRDENIIKNTVRRLPMQVIVPLLTELSTLVQGKTLMSQTGALWLHHLVQVHASPLIANPQLVDLIGPVLGTIENRLSLLTPISRLRGRLDLLVTQLTSSTKKEEEPEEALLVYRDQGSSESESEDNIEVNLHSDSENEWVEEETSESDVEIKENNVSDSEMSI